jgi:tight adherence protein C
VSLPSILAGLAGALAAGGVASLIAARRDAKRDRPPQALRLLALVGSRWVTPGGGGWAAPGGGDRVARALPRDLEARIAAAGRPGGLGARELMAAKLAACGVAAAFALALAGAAPGRLALVLLVAAPAAGFLAPDLWLARQAAARARRIRRDLPALLDLLRVMVEAGGSLAAALRAVGARAHGPLAAEWRAAGREVALGVPLEHALAGLAARAPLPEVHALVAALDRARRHGVPLADALSAQARDARFALARHAREEAARAGPKIQLVVALLLVPSVLLLVAAALLAALTGSGSGSGVLPIG